MLPPSIDPTLVSRVADQSWEEANEKNKALAGRLAREWVKSRPRALYQPSTPEAFGFAPLTRPELVRLVKAGLAKLFTLMEEAGLDPEKQFTAWSRELREWAKIWEGRKPLFSDLLPVFELLLNDLASAKGLPMDSLVEEALPAIRTFEARAQGALVVLDRYVTQRAGALVSVYMTLPTGRTPESMDGFMAHSGGASVRSLSGGENLSGAMRGLGFVILRYDGEPASEELSAVASLGVGEAWAEYRRVEDRRLREYPQWVDLADRLTHNDPDKTLAVDIILEGERAGGRSRSERAREAGLPVIEVHNASRRLKRTVSRAREAGSSDDRQREFLRLVGRGIDKDGE